MSNPNYIAIVGDVVGSRQVKDRDDLQERLRAGLGEVNDKFRSTVASRFVLTVGDEFQGLLNSAADLDRILSTLWNHANPTELRYGIGVGRLNTVLQPQAIGMDGPCFHYARTAVERAEKQKTSVEAEIGERNPALEIYASLVGFMRKKWTLKQRRVVDLSMSGMEGKAIAALLRIKPAAVSQHLSAAGAAYLARATEEWLRVLGQAMAREQ